jgi:hypothetical protein
MSLGVAGSAWSTTDAGKRGYNYIKLGVTNIAGDFGKMIPYFICM